MPDVRQQILAILKSAKGPLSASDIAEQIPNSLPVVVRFALGDLIHHGEIEMKSAPSPAGAHLVYWLRSTRP